MGILYHNSFTIANLFLSTAEKYFTFPLDIVKEIVYNETVRRKNKATETKNKGRKRKMANKTYAREAEEKLDVVLRENHKNYEYLTAEEKEVLREAMEILYNLNRKLEK